MDIAKLLVQNTEIITSKTKSIKEHQHVPTKPITKPVHHKKRHACTWLGCRKSFSRPSDMTRHYRIHTNDRPYQCPLSFCGKRFIQRSALTVHQRTHSGEKPHICQFPSCNKSFGDSSSLARHRRIHTQTRSYVCTEMYCTKSYTKKSHLTRHTRRSHIKDENSESMFASKMKKTINPVPTAATTDDDDDEEEEEVDYDPALVKQEILTNRISPAMVCPSNAVNQQPNYWAMNPPCYIPTVYQSAGDGYFYHGQQNYYSF